MKNIQLLTAIKRILIPWLVAFILLTLLLILQNLNDKYGSESNSSWYWLLIHTAPFILTILIGYFRHKRLSSLVLAGADIILYRIILFLSCLYILILMFVMMQTPFAKSNYTEAQNLHAADFGLLILQGIVLFVLFILIFKTEKRFAAINATESTDVLAGEPGVFISYNHSDKVIADKIKVLLEKQNIPVTIDSENMLAGENIQSFIENSILKNRTTLSIVSNKSLLSGWVGMETYNTFFLKKFSKSKQLISCYIDDDFFQMDFTANAIQSFDKQLLEVNSQIAKHNELGIDTRDLNEFKTRLLALRNQLDEIISQLRNSLCIDIRDEKLTENFHKIVQTIQQD